MSMTHAIRIEHVLSHPPSRVWRALTDPPLQSKWLMRGTFRAEVGAAFTLEAGAWGTVHCEVLELVPERTLRFSWKNPPLDTTVSFRLEPEGTGTRLLFEHDGFEVDDPQQRYAFDAMGGGWRSMLATRFEAVLAEIS
jgi:uncharacterized protein YndB with AHSA1/START domain